MTKCPDCGSTDVAWRRGKNGRPYLTDTKKPHSIFCPGRKKGAKPKIAKPAKADPVVALVVGWLKDEGYKKAEAERLVAVVGGTWLPADADVLYLKAMAVSVAEKGIVT